MVWGSLTLHFLPAAFGRELPSQHSLTLSWFPESDPELPSGRRNRKRKRTETSQRRTYTTAPGHFRQPPDRAVPLSTRRVSSPPSLNKDILCWSNQGNRQLASRQAEHIKLWAGVGLPTWKPLRASAPVLPEQQEQKVRIPGFDFSSSRKRMKKMDAKDCQLSDLQCESVPS